MAFTPTDVRLGGSFVQDLSGFQRDTLELGSFFAGKSAEKRKKQEGIQLEKDTKQALSEVRSVDDQGKPLLQQREVNSDADRAFNKASITAYNARVQVDVVDTFKRLEEKYSGDPEGYKAAKQGYVEGLYSEIGEPVRLNIESLVDRLDAETQFRIDGNFKSATAAKDLADTNGAITTHKELLRKAIRAGDGQGMQDSIAYITQAVDSPSYSLEESEEILAGVMKLSLLETETSGLLSHIRNDEKLEAATETERLRLMEPPQGISVDEWDKQIDGIVKEGKEINDERRIIKAETQKLFEVENTFKLNDLEEQVKLGGVTREELTKGYDLGIIPDLNKLNALDDLRIKALKEGDDEKKIALKILGGGDGEVIPSASVNKYYEKNIASLTDTDKALYVDSVKMVPAALRAQIDNDLLSGNPDLAAAAGALIDSIDEIPGIESPFSASNRAFAEWVVKLSQNMSPQEAVAKAQELTDPRNKNLIEARKVEFRDMTTGFNAKTFSIDGVIERGLFNVDVKTSSSLDRANMQKEYSDLIEAQFLAGSSLEASEKKAAEMVRRNWKEQTFLGRTEAFKYPLAQYYSVSGSIAYAEKQLMSEVKKKLLFNEEITREDVYLLSDKRTAEEANTGNPTYLIYTVQNGVMNVTGQRFKPDMEEEKVSRDKRLNDLRIKVKNKLPEFQSL